MKIQVFQKIARGEALVAGIALASVFFFKPLLAHAAKLEQNARAAGGGRASLTSTTTGAATARTVAESPMPSELSDEPMEVLAGKLWTALPREAQCLAVKSEGPSQATTHLDPKLDETLQTLIQGIKSLQPTLLLPLFHPRLKTSLAALKKAATQQQGTLTPPFEVSLYRLFALYTPDGRARELPCPGDEISVYPHYGYKLQFAAWLQVLGQKELGRIYVSLVPHSKEDWVIGFYHFQQWTHAQMPYNDWLAAAATAHSTRDYVTSYMQADIAAKLLAGSPHFNLQALGAALNLRNEADSQIPWKAEVRQALARWQILEASTIFVNGGLGLLVRTQIPAEISSEAVRNDCNEIKASLQKKPWFSQVKGVRCSYVIAGEDPEKEGRLGSLFVTNP